MKATARGSWYAEGPIRETLAAIGRPTVDPYHVEAWMRLGRGTLDGLLAQGTGPGSSWRREVAEAADCVEASTPEENERLAATYGLDTRGRS